MLTMGRLLVCFAALLSLSFEDAFGDQNRNPHKYPICIKCECLDIKPFLVQCNDMNFKELPHVEQDLELKWRWQLQSNALKEIPAFTQLKNLTSISFRYNQISEIVEAAFYNLTGLKKLDLSHNNISVNTLTLEVFQGPYNDKLPLPIPLQDLNLSNNKLQRLHKHVFRHLINLTSLDLSHNPFTDLSKNTAEAISELQNLKKLDLSFTNLRRLPQHFFSELINLKELDLSGNVFADVPREVNYAHSLQSLSFNFNPIQVIPAHLFWDTLVHLENLQMRGSATLFSVERGAFNNLTSLKTLWLSDNSNLKQFMFQPTNGKQYKTLQLKELHLEHNALSTLPEDALPWTDIPYLNLQGNPWNCDCNLEWLVKDVLPSIQKQHFEITIRAVCNEPVELMGQRMTDPSVQKHNFECIDYNRKVEQYGIVIVATIAVGTILLITGTIIFSYFLFKRTKIHEWVGENVRYQRTWNDDEESITSNVLY